MEECAVEFRGITKVFPGVTANENIDLRIYPGEVHALLGENGAGKTTLMSMLFGLYPPTAGSILVDGRECAFGSPADAIRAGLGMVHQHFMLVQVFTVWENIILGVEPTDRSGIVQRARAVERIQRLAREYGLPVDPDKLIEDLPVGVQQRVEILKALYGEAKCLILDEPTAVLTPEETGRLFEVIRGLRQAGKTVIFISHKLREVREIADRVTVLRHGKIVKTTTPKEASDRELARMMVGREIASVVNTRPRTDGAEVLSVKDLTVLDEHRRPVIDRISFAVHEGEVFGIAGVQGNGQTELIESVAGLRAPAPGSEVCVDGVPTTWCSPAALTKAGMAHIPEDRQLTGLVPSLAVKKNLILKSFATNTYANRLRMRWNKVDEDARRLTSEFDIRTPSIDTPVKQLSGGNQQKVILARELQTARRVLIACQPTRGLDVGAIEFVHAAILGHRAKGVGVLLVSTELDEILALADRVAVMYEGRFVAVMPRSETTMERLGLLMAGREDGPDSSSAHMVSHSAVV